jgi:hypothetical protein
MLSKIFEHILLLSQIMLGIACVCLIAFFLIDADNKNIAERVARNLCKVTEGHLVREIGNRGDYFCYSRNKDGKTFSRVVLNTGEN